MCASSTLRTGEGTRKSTFTFTRRTSLLPALRPRPLNWRLFRSRATVPARRSPGSHPTWRRGADWDGTKPDPDEEAWRMREAGVVIERNLCTDSAVGVIVESGARAVVRDNRARNVTVPLARPKAT